ncbi:CoA pyrophosphatase [Polynucleobacter sp. 30F-ANTBAC]|jgi:8-oxo-dGTP pyrophosphatase MutT (NUDIX family)|uniref:CoA pyrophosphatase n=1 Tax=Polynucleobacter sp. 30F-ANTBAC TaxID=2689095 RepID=UPI001C0BEEAE|nr:CoA pyrophosphatase [Polynucleobacter sp. 30F-ANTBAC]MBU3599432.1 CoA pyrophosphatase [Polynucleobacter sp. 30F-ANTBAC]
MTSKSNLPPFDPQAVPIVARDSHLPSVPKELMGISGMRMRFAENKEWSVEVTHENRTALSARGAQIAGRGDAPTPAAVLIPLIAYEGEFKILLTQRTAHLHDHPGQISFPGGRSDPDDLSPEFTALREAEEEIGLPKNKVEVLGCLPNYLTITGYQVTPVVGIIMPGHTYQADKFEVADIFEVPLSFLMNPHHHEHRSWQGPEGERHFYAMPYENKFIWGATAGMLRNLYHFLRA